jgi:hypothetical protein
MRWMVRGRDSTVIDCGDKERRVRNFLRVLEKFTAKYELRRASWRKKISEIRQFYVEILLCP